MAYYLSYTRNEVIDAALRKMGVLSSGASATTDEYTDAAEALKNIIRNINLSGNLPYIIGPDWYGTRTNYEKAHTIDLGRTVVDVAAASIVTPLGQVLANQNFASGTSWSRTADVTFPNPYALYTHATGAGSFSQANAELTKTYLTNGVSCLFSYAHTNSSGAVQDLKFKFSGTLFNRNCELPITDEASIYTSHGVIASVADNTANFMVAGTSTTAGIIYFNYVALYALSPTEYPLIRITQSEYAAIADKATVAATDIPQYYCIDRSHDKTVMRLWPGMGTAAAARYIKYLPMRQMQIPHYSTDVIDVSQDMYRFIIWQLAADLSAEWGRGLDERAWLSQQAGEALSIVTGAGKEKE